MNMINLLQKIIMNQSDVIIVMKSNIIKMLKELTEIETIKMKHLIIKKNIIKNI